MKIFSGDLLNELVSQAYALPRLRQHKNIHTSYDEPCQRLFNAIGLASYIRPHRHASTQSNELLVAVRGLMVLMTFNDVGQVQQIVQFGSEKYGSELAVGVELNPQTWHTVLALQPSSVLLEVKAGPFDPDQPKDFAPWAPAENSTSVHSYMKELKKMIGMHSSNCSMSCL